MRLNAYFTFVFDEILTVVSLQLLENMLCPSPAQRCTIDEVIEAIVPAFQSIGVVRLISSPPSKSSGLPVHEMSMPQHINSTSSSAIQSAASTPPQGAVTATQTLNPSAMQFVSASTTPQERTTKPNSNLHSTVSRMETMI
jgi:hypothetical protein